jgi:hypothetical protein
VSYYPASANLDLAVAEPVVFALVDEAFTLSFDGCVESVFWAVEVRGLLDMLIHEVVLP